MKNLKYVFIVVFFVAVLIMAYFVYRTPDKGNKTFPVKKEENVYFGKNSLLNPAVSANLGKHYIINIKPLRDILIEIQKKYPQKTFVYFLYLNNGVWIGLNEKDEFEAASTLKVPLAMSVLKSVEEKRLVLGAPYSIEESELNSEFGDFYKNGANGQYTMEELLHVMLEKSDNTAMNAVFNSITRLGIDDPLADVYTALGWQFLSPPALDEKPNYEKINLKTLSNMFISLYNATFLSPENSQMILGYLANTPFDEKIKAGVPDGVIVSHKIGISGDTGTFSDCGIVYAPNRNYILCLGSNGENETRANQFMEEVSTAVYQFVINN